MDAIFTLPYSEYAAANLLADHFKPSKGFSIFIPASRGEKGVDLLLSTRGSDGTKAVTFQVKASRTYMGKQPVRAPRVERFSYYTWFNRFEVPQQADFFMMFGLFPPEQIAGKAVSKSWWQSMCLVYSREEMEGFMKEIKNQNGSPNKMFGFGFNGLDRVMLTRGSQTGHIDVTDHLFVKQVTSIRDALKAN